MMTLKVMVWRSLLLILGMTGAVLSGGLLIAQASINAGGQGAPVAVLDTQPETVGDFSQELTFPYCLGNDLWLEMVTGYEGLYPEDESMKPVADAAAILLYNGGDKMLKDLEITLVTDGGDLVFSGTYLPAGERTMILAQEKAVYTKQKVFKAEAKFEVLETPPAQAIAFADWEGKGLRLVNTGLDTVRDITVFYKTYYKELGFYFGGLTYQAYAGSLDAGEETILPLPNYASGYSRVLLVVSEMP